jgi:tetratricopeptide (TPR) repeat protein
VANFDPLSERESYLSDDRAMLHYFVEREFDPDIPLGNGANSDLVAAISGALVGLYGEMAPIIPRAVDWLTQAIEKDEELGTNQDFYRQQLHAGKALALWMRDGVNAAEDWNAARQALKSASQQDNVYSRVEIKSDYLDRYLALCYQAGQYEEGIAEYEKYHGVKVLSPNKTLPPRKVAYALCLHEARRQFDQNELFEAGRKMLQSYLQGTWLKGQFDYAAMWLKIVYWHRDPSLTPLQTLLKAYENMPDVPRPDFVSAA